MRFSLQIPLRHIRLTVFWLQGVFNSVPNLCHSAATALVEGKIGKSLKKVLKKVVAKDAHEQLAISDVKLGGVIKVSDAEIYIIYMSIQ